MAFQILFSVLLWLYSCGAMPMAHGFRNIVPDAAVAVLLLRGTHNVVAPRICFPVLLRLAVGEWMVAPMRMSSLALNLLQTNRALFSSSFVAQSVRSVLEGLQVYNGAFNTAFPYGDETLAI